MSVGEVVAPRAFDVLVGGVTAARLSGLCLCGGEHISPIAEGAATVLVNGLPMARVGDHTLEGGVIAFGELSVLAGGEAFSVPSFIAIEGHSDFQMKVLRDLHIISTTPTGRRLFASMASTGRRVRIVPWGPKAAEERSHMTMTDPQLVEPRLGNSRRDYNDPRASNGIGIDAKIEYNPDDWGALDGKGVEWRRSPNFSPDVSLVHEMVHADDIMHGTIDEGWCRNPGGWPNTPCGERRARGLPPFDDTARFPNSENTYRDDRGYKRAEHH
jgi:uncharacterized Zn-binding protein involved in type VI secretion